MVKRDRGGRAPARAVRRLSAPERFLVTIQNRRAEAEPAYRRAARVLNPRAVLLFGNVRKCLRVSGRTNAEVP